MTSLGPRSDYVGFSKLRVLDCGLLQVLGVPIAAVAKSGSATDITTGILPAAQVPGLDASKVTTGTISLARLPPSASNIFTGNNQNSPSGSGTLPFSQGGFMGWNRDGGSGQTLFANNRGGGIGGWEFVSYNNNQTFGGVAATLTSSGGLTLASVQSGTTLLAANGNVVAGGLLSLSQGSSTGGTQMLLGQASSPSCQHVISTRHSPTTLQGNAIDTYLWTWGVDGTNPGSKLALSLTQTGLGINNVPNPAYGLDCNGSVNAGGVIRGLGMGGLLLRVFDESSTAFPSTGSLPEVFKGRPIDSQFITAINYPYNSAGVAIAPGVTQNYSARISGYILAPSSDTYTFSVFTDDGVRLWVNNTKVLDAWNVQSTTLTSSAFVLQQTWVPFRLEYVQGAYGSGLQVSWRGAANNTSYATLAHSTSGAGFQFAYDNIERPPCSLGTVYFNGKAFFTENVGFGGQAAPSYPIDLLGGVRASGDSYFNGAAMGSLGTVNSAGMGYQGLGAASYALQQSSAGATSLNTASGLAMAFRDSNVTGMTYKAKCLRIGDANAPSCTLDVAGVAQVAPAKLGLVVGTATGGAASLASMANGNYVELGVATTAGDFSSSSAAGDAVIRALPTSTGGQNKLLLQTGSGNASLAISSSGGIGIGTTTPSRLLDVAGTGHFTGSLQTDGVVFMNNQANPCMLALSSTTAGVPASNSTSYYGLGMTPGSGLRYQVATSANDSHIFMGGTTEIARLTNSGSGSTISGPFNVTGLSTFAGALVSTRVNFSGTNSYVTASASGDSLSIIGGGGKAGLAVDANSRVGIGTVNPGFPIDIVGAARIQSSGAPAALYSYANGQTSQYWYSGSDANNNYVVYNQQNVGAYIANGQTSWSANSDERLKEDIRMIPSGLALLNDIRPVSFKWKAGMAPGYGVVAQEVQKVLPDIVDEHVTGATSQPPLLGVRYQDLIPFLVRAVQELYEMVL